MPPSLRPGERDLVHTTLGLVAQQRGELRLRGDRRLLKERGRLVLVVQREPVVHIGGGRLGRRPVSLLVAQLRQHLALLALELLELGGRATNLLLLRCQLGFGRSRSLVGSGHQRCHLSLPRLQVEVVLRQRVPLLLHGKQRSSAALGVEIQVSSLGVEEEAQGPEASCRRVARPIPDHLEDAAPRRSNGTVAASRRRPMALVDLNDEVLVLLGDVNVLWCHEGKRAAPK